MFVLDIVYWFRGLVFCLFACCFCGCVNCYFGICCLFVVYCSGLLPFCLTC